MNSWLSGWTKKRYKEVCKDLCTCFIKRGFSLSDDRGYEALITSDTCMYISSFEKMRKEVIERTSIVCFIDTRGTNAHPDVFDANAGWVLWNHPGANIKGSYFKLNHPIPEKGQGLLEALANPDCGWFYRADASGFEAIPGSPIAYWASEAAITAFNSGPMFGELANPSAGITTGDNASFIHYWWEQGIHDISFATVDFANRPNDRRWFPCNKGGSFRKWYGNKDNIMAFDDSSIEKMRHLAGYRPVNIERQFKSSISWSDITSGINSFRANGAYSLYDHVGISAFPNESSFSYLLALLNSSVTSYYLVLIAPTLHCNAGDIAKLPVLGARKQHVIDAMAADCVELSKIDWNAFETSWEFRKHPLV